MTDEEIAALNRLSDLALHLLWRSVGDIERGRIDHKDGSAICRFCNAATEFIRQQMFGNRSDTERNIEKLRKAYQGLPAYLQLRVAATAQECGCREQLAAVIGRL